MENGRAELSADSRAVGIGIDVGGTKILAGAVTTSGEVLAISREPSPADTDDLAAALCAAVDGLTSMLGDDAGRVRALGLALPGLVRPDGVLRAAPNLGAAADVDIQIGPRFGEPVIERIAAAGGSISAGAAYDNDATCAAFAEATVGAAAGDGDVVVISFGTGIGAGVVIGGKVVRGGHGFAGEIGHVVIDPNGPDCPCGRRGCWERYASGPALAALARAKGLGLVGDSPSHPTEEELRAEDVVDAARAGDALALEIVEDFASWVALGLSNAVELLDPARFVLGGGLMQSADVLLQPIRKAFVAETRPAHQRDGSDLVVATLGGDAALIGAALLGLEKLGAE